MCCSVSFKLETNIFWHLGNYFYLLYYFVLTVLCSLRFGQVTVNLKIWYLWQILPWKISVVEKYFDLFWSQINDEDFIPWINQRLDSLLKLYSTFSGPQNINWFSIFHENFLFSFYESKYFDCFLSSESTLS